MDQNDTSTEETTSEWPSFSADRTLAKSAARSLRLDTQQANADGKIMEFNSELDQIRTRLSSVERQAFELPNPGQAGPMDNEIRAFREDMLKTRARFEELSTRVSTAEEHISTALIQSIDSFDTRLAVIEKVRLTQTDELNELTGYLEQAFQQIAELAEVIEGQQGSVDEVRAEVGDVRTEVGGALEKEESARLEVANALSNVEASLNRFDTVETAIKAVESELEKVRNLAEANAEKGAAQELQLAERTDAIDLRINELETTVQALPSSEDINPTASVDNEMLLAHEAKLETSEANHDALAEKIVSHTQRLDDQAETIQNIGDRASALRTSVEQFENTIEQNSQQIAKQNETISSQTEIFEVQVSALEEQKSTLANHQAAILEIQDLQQSLSNQEENLDSDRLASIEDTTGSLQSSVEDISAKVDELETRLATVADTPVEADGQDSETVEALRAELSTLSSQVEQTSQQPEESAELTNRIDDLTAQVREAELRLDDSSVRANETDAKIENAGIRIDQVTEDFGQLNDFAISSSEQIDTISTDLAMVNSRVDDLVSQGESQPSGQQVDTQEIQALATSAVERADQAHAFAENLRMIQADLVQAIQSELASHGERLDGMDNDEETNTRIEHLESKLVEAWQTISQLTELERRHTHVETQMTDALTATTQGVEHTQQHVLAMRTELESALQRVARLETMLTNSLSAPATAAPAPAAPAQAAPVQAAPVAQAAPAQAAPAPAEPAAQVDDDGADTEWFTESYSRRNAS